jgi:hypothetical protein
LLHSRTKCADLTERDHQAHLAAIDEGRIEAIDDIG